VAHTWLFARLSVPPVEKAILAPLCAIGEIVDILRAHDPAACWLFQRAKSGGHRRLELWLRAERDVLDTLSGRLVAEPATGAFEACLTAEEPPVSRHLGETAARTAAALSCASSDLALDLLISGALPEPKVLPLAVLHLRHI